MQCSAFLPGKPVPSTPFPTGSLLPGWKVGDFTRVVPVSELLTNSGNKA